MSSFLGTERLLCGLLKHSFAIFAVSGWSKPFWRGLGHGVPRKRVDKWLNRPLLSATGAVLKLPRKQV